MCWFSRKTKKQVGPPSSARELLDRYASGERQFQHANLEGADLKGANLYDVDLRDASLAGADLSGSQLGGALLDRANLANASLFRVKVEGAFVDRSTSFCGADLSDANLMFASLSGADFSGATMVRAAFSWADMTGAKFVRANLAGADLGNVTLLRTVFQWADLRAVTLTGTKILAIDATPLCDAIPPVHHEGPSFVDLATIAMSIKSPNLREFLRRSGTPDALVEGVIKGALALGVSVVDSMRSTFISYGGPDESFARRLYEALHRNGVRCFLFSEHATPGEKLHRTMKRGVNEHDRVVLICSRASLDRKGVLTELEETLAREHRDGEEYLIPIRLDRYVLDEWRPKNQDVARAVRDRVIGDFEGADQDEERFQAGLRRLLAALRK